MTRADAIAILKKSEADVVVDEEDATATINGTLTIEELQAILQLLEYTA